MKVRLKEDPKEWRKSVLLTFLGVAMLSSVLRWRHVIPGSVWRLLLVVAAVGSAAACLYPRGFRGYYRLSTRAGFWLSQVVARVVLALLFIVLITPLGVLLRLLGKDPLRLKRSRTATTYWTDAKKRSSLDQMF